MEFHKHMMNENIPRNLTRQQCYFIDLWILKAIRCVLTKSLIKVLKKSIPLHIFNVNLLIGW